MTVHDRIRGRVFAFDNGCKTIGTESLSHTNKIREREREREKEKKRKEKEREEAKHGMQYLLFVVVID
jgi:hypothetical protein